MKLTSCSKCNAVLPTKKTSIVEGKRVCGNCKKEVQNKK